MKTIILKIAIFFLNIIYFFFKLLPIKNKVTFISRQGNTKSEDFKLIGRNLKKRHKGIKIVFLCKKLEGNIFKKIGYFFHMFRQMYHLSTSKVIVLDSYCITASVLKKKKNTTVIQMWHAMGAFKKFGHSIIGEEEGASKELASVMKMHGNYDYVFASSDYCKKFFKEAFNVSMDKVITMPLPRVDLLTDTSLTKNIKENIYDKYPILKRKKNIVYAPTFRKTNEQASVKNIYELIDSVNYSKYNLIIKLHPLSKIRIKDSRVIIDKSFSTVDMMKISHYVITDYSAIVFEACLLNKPIYFYCYDYKEYYRKRNFYLDYNKDMPGLITENPKEILKAIEKREFNINSVRDFTDKYIMYQKGNCTSNIVDFILSKM